MGGVYLGVKWQVPEWLSAMCCMVHRQSTASSVFGHGTVLCHVV